MLKLLILAQLARILLYAYGKQQLNAKVICTQWETVEHV